MNRLEMINRVKSRKNDWDFIIIGGGATGVGCAVDAATRGLDVLLLEQHDFGKGTSSRSTKLIHGGVRYLKHGDISLVRESLKERGTLLRNAPHVVEKRAFIVPCYSNWQKFYYGFGLKIYDFLAGKYSFGKSQILTKESTIRRLPNLKSENLSGGVLYFDGQFDDTRLLIDLAKTACDYGAAILNYAPVFGLIKDENRRVCGVNFTDSETGERFAANAKVVINATGAFCDAIRKFSDINSEALIAPSQGIHLVFDKSFLSSDTAIMIPKTDDGRVLFAIPFHGKTLVGTTDTQIENTSLEPQAFESEIDFIIETASKFLAKPPKREDILSVFAGIRPLVKSGNVKSTAKLSRDHTIEIDASNLLTITGGKWTTYRSMAEDAIDQAIEMAGFAKSACSTQELRITETANSAKNLLIEENPNLAEQIHSEFDYRCSNVIYAARNEMARTIEDVLARRTRMLFLDANVTLESAPKVAELMAQELGKDHIWIDSQLLEFEKTARNYRFESRL